MGGVAEWERDFQGGAGAGRAVQPQAAAECLGPVFEPDQAGAVAKVSAAAPVVADAQVQAAATGRGLDVGDGGACVLGGVGECLGDGVIGGSLDRVGQPPADQDVEVNRDGGSAGQRFEGRGQAAVGQDGGVQAAGDLA